MERELFEKILNSLIEGIVVVDSDETIAFINDEAPHRFEKRRS
jgi:sensor histidine kinase regulating citrate/malate metabolism